MDSYGFIDNRDSSHNNSFAAIAFRVKKIIGEDLHKNTAEELKYITPVYEILFKPFAFWFKNPDFTFSNAEGWRQKVYEKFLKYLKCNPYCHVSADQVDPLIIYSCFTQNHKFIKKFIIGMVCKLGFFGNNGELIFWKLDHLAPIARLYNVKFVYYFLDILSYLSATFAIKKPIKEETTNKIRLYLHLIHAELTGTQTKWTKKIKEEILKSPDMFEILEITNEQKGYWITHRQEAFSLYFTKVFRTYFNSSSNSVIYKNMPYNILN